MFQWNIVIPGLGPPAPKKVKAAPVKSGTKRKATLSAAAPPVEKVAKTGGAATEAVGKDRT